MKLTVSVLTVAVLRFGAGIVGAGDPMSDKEAKLTLCGSGHQRHGQRYADARGWRILLGHRYRWEGSQASRRCEHETG